MYNKLNDVVNTVATFLEIDLQKAFNISISNYYCKLISNRVAHGFFFRSLVGHDWIFAECIFIWLK